MLNNIDLLKLVEEVAVSGVVCRNMKLMQQLLISFLSMSKAIFQIEIDTMGVKNKGSIFYAHRKHEVKPSPDNSYVLKLFFPTTGFL